MLNLCKYKVNIFWGCIGFVVIGVVLMDILLRVVFYLSGFVIIWAMFGYPKSLKLIGRLYKSRQLVKDYGLVPSVTVMVVAHNEEKVILEKLNNILELDYPKDRIEFLIASDNSTDRTNEIVKDFIAGHPGVSMRLYEVLERKGKTNAQNEAHKTVVTEFLVMTDANSIMEKASVRELMAAFTSSDIAYVTGRLLYVNQAASDVSSAEITYWYGDLATREIEGRIQTITSGNGSLYACRTIDYVDFKPIECHDIAMPTYYALAGRRAIANHDAIVYEKAGEVIGDEFGRKVRMNRKILQNIMPDFRILNFFKYRWFTYFYLGHRTCRYSLWISHLLVLVSNVLLVGVSWFYVAVLVVQLLFYLMALLKVVTRTDNKVLTMVYYYLITVVAQWVGVYRIVTGKAKPTWEKAESTR